MDMARLISSLRRRWYLTVAVLVVAVVGTGYVVEQVGPTYSIQATVLLLPPASTTGQGAGQTPDNPYLSLQGLNPARDILVRDMTSKALQLQVQKIYPGVSFDMYADQSVGGPIIELSVTGPARDDAAGALDLLLGKTPYELGQLQTALHISSHAQISSEVLTKDPTATVVRKSQIRLGIVAAAGLLLLGLLTIGLVDGLALSRPRAQTAAGRLPRVRRTAPERDADLSVGPIPLDGSRRSAEDRSSGERPRSAVR